MDFVHLSDIAMCIAHCAIAIVIIYYDIIHYEWNFSRWKWVNAVGNARRYQAPSKLLLLFKTSVMIHSDDVKQEAHMAWACKFVGLVGLEGLVDSAGCKKWGLY